jgi:hypothetical protein
MMLILLNNGYVTQVDDADFKWLNARKWYAKMAAYTLYVCRSERINGVVHTIRMHRLITNCPDNMEVDHKDGDSFNNQRSNLEIVKKSENLFRRQCPLFRPNNH